MEWLFDILPEELMVNQEYIFSKIKKVCDFETGFFYFPEHFPKEFIENHKFTSVYLPEEKRLLLPLLVDDRPVGVLVLNKIFHIKNYDFLIEYASLCVENVLLKKMSELDLITGLYNQYAFLDILRKEIEKIDNFLLNSNHLMDTHEHKPFLSSFSLFIIRFAGFDRIEKNYGHHVKERVLKEISEKLRKKFLSGFYVGYLKDGDFSIIIPDFRKRECKHLYDSLQELNRVTLKEENMEIEFNICMGYIFYPQDVNIFFTGKSSLEKANILLENAYKCLKLSEQLSIGICGVNELLKIGGEIVEVKNNKCKINLGRREGIREGDTFFIYSKDHIFSDDVYFSKGEIIITDVDNEYSIGEILYIRPDEEIKINDRTVFYKDEYSNKIEKIDCCQQNVLDLKNFLSFFKLQKDKEFSLFIVGSESKGIKDVFKQYGRYFPFLHGLNPVVGEYGKNSIISYIPISCQKQLIKIGKDIYNVLKQKGFNPIIGIAYYPCLNFLRRDILSNARQAFELAFLLTDERIVLFDSITLTLKGDRLFRSENYLSAMEEYKLALILDENNILARNSLGICYTILGEFTKAKLEFERILECTPDNMMALYNLGCLNLKIGDLDEAKRIFKKCLFLDKSNPFPVLRLAQIAENKGEFKRAKALYKMAIKNGNANFAYRLLAELLLKEGKRAEAKNFLHKGIAANPFDHRAFFLLAKISFEEQKDLDIALSFLKRSITIKPDEESYRKLLYKLYELKKKR